MQILYNKQILFIQIHLVVLHCLLLGILQIHLQETIITGQELTYKVHTLTVVNHNKIKRMIKEVENFIDKAEADHLMYLIDKFAHKSTVAGSKNQYSKLDNARTSYSATLDSKNPTIKKIHQRIAKYLGVPISKGEVLQGQRCI